MTIKINGEEFSKEEALKIIEKKDVVVNQITIPLLGDPNREKSPLSHEGFAVEQDVISEMSENMTRFKAGFMKFSVEKSPKIMGRDFYIFMVEPDHLSWWKKKILNWVL